MTVLRRSGMSVRCLINKECGAESVSREHSLTSSVGDTVGVPDGDSVVLNVVGYNMIKTD